MKIPPRTITLNDVVLLCYACWLVGLLCMDLSELINPFLQYHLMVGFNLREDDSDPASWIRITHFAHSHEVCARVSDPDSYSPLFGQKVFCPYGAPVHTYVVG